MASSWQMMQVSSASPLPLQETRTLPFSTTYHFGLVLGGVVKHRYLRAWFQHVEKTVSLVGKALLEIVVHPQPW